MAFSNILTSTSIDGSAWPSSSSSFHALSTLILCVFAGFLMFPCWYFDDQDKTKPSQVTRPASLTSSLIPIKATLDYGISCYLSRTSNTSILCHVGLEKHPSIVRGNSTKIEGIACIYITVIKVATFAQQLLSASESIEKLSLHVCNFNCAAFQVFWHLKCWN